MPQKRLRILHVINSLEPTEGGTVECVRQIGTAVSSRGHTVEVAVCRDTRSAEWIASFPLKVYALGPAYGRYAYTPKLKPWLMQNGRNYDAWVINGLWQYQGLGASRAARRLGVPYFVYPHGMMDPWNRRATPLRYAKKFLYWLLAERYTMENARALVFTSTAESILAKHYFPISRWNSVVTGNGISIPPPVGPGAVAAFRSKYLPQGPGKLMLFLSRIHPKKGIEDLLRALAGRKSERRSDVLVIAGDGDPAYVANLKSMGSQLGLDRRVFWAGALYGSEKWTAFRAADLFVLPSHQENFGIVIAEAMACGKPVLTTTGVNIHRTITDSDAGFVCADSQSGIASGLEWWDALSDKQIAAHGRNAIACFLQNFEVMAASGKLLAAIGNAVANREDEGRNR
jgi:glycosyltransferase involved in cell wall biosynthesis